MDSRKRHEFRGVSDSGLIAVGSLVTRGALERGFLQKRSAKKRSGKKRFGKRRSEERRSGLCVEDLAWVEDSVGVKLGFDTPHQLNFGFCTTEP
jgi:hypothetical protein